MFVRVAGVLIAMLLLTSCGESFVGTQVETPEESARRLMQTEADAMDAKLGIDTKGRTLTSRVSAFEMALNAPVDLDAAGLIAEVKVLTELYGTPSNPEQNMLKAVSELEKACGITNVDEGLVDRVNAILEHFQDEPELTQLKLRLARVQKLALKRKK